MWEFLKFWTAAAVVNTVVSLLALIALCICAWAICKLDGKGRG